MNRGCGSIVLSVYLCESVPLRFSKRDSQPHLRPCSMDKVGNIFRTRGTGQAALIFIRYSNNWKFVLTGQDRRFLIPTLP